jgi:hypothetical protein
MKPYLLLFFVPLLAGCLKHDPPVTDYYPVLMSRESLDKSIVFHTPETISDPAKIYYKDNFIFVSERFKGIHIIDNTDPKNPVNRGYISIPGCLDMAIKGNVLYADNAVDMVVLDLSTIGTANFKVLKRVRNIFPELAPPDGKALPTKYLAANRPANTILVAWQK